MHNKKTAFTLVELIVVITILAILGTIAFISMSGYSATSRDSVRLSDASSMRTSLEIYQVNAGKYPLPNQNGYFTLDSETLWWQGKFNGTVIDNLSRNFSEAPQDPISEKTYTYSVAGNKNEYQLLVLLEGGEVSNITHPNPLLIREGIAAINQTNAATQSRTPKVSGTYNGLYIKTTTKFVALPSIITALDFNQGANSLTGVMMTSMIVNGYDNVPNEGNIKYVTGSLDVPEVIYSTGTVSSTDGDGAKASVVRMLQNAYSGSNLSNDGIHKYIINLEDDDKVLANVLDTVVLGNAADVVSTDTTCGGIPTGGTKNFFSASSVSAGGNCDSVKKTFTCDNKLWKDEGADADTATYSHTSCLVEDDTQAPTGGSMVINSNASSTSSTSVTLNVTCPTDAAGSTPIEIAYGNTPNPSNWTTCTSSISHTLTSGDGTKTVYYKFRDSALNETTETSDSIDLNIISVICTVDRSGTKWENLNNNAWICFEDQWGNRVAVYKLSNVGTGVPLWDSNKIYTRDSGSPTRVKDTTYYGNYNHDTCSWSGYTNDWIEGCGSTFGGINGRQYGHCNDGNKHLLTYCNGCTDTSGWTNSVHVGTPSGGGFGMCYYPTQHFGTMTKIYTQN